MSADIHALSGAYAVDALDDVERAQFELHLAGCSACQAEVQSLDAAATELSVLSDWAPPAELRSRVLHGITLVRPLPPLARVDLRPDETATSLSSPPAATSPSSAVAPPVTDELAKRRGRHAEGRSSPARWLVAAATAGVLAVGGFTAWRSTTGADAPPPTVAEQVRNASDSTTSKAVPFPGGGSATIVRSPSLGKAIMVTSNLANPPTGKVYQLWLQDRTGHFASAGLMSTAGNQAVVLEGNAAESQAAGITIEPAGGSLQPTSNPIAFYSFA
ncbi:MAG: anti-sigma factor [Humibacillus sp.]